MSKYQGGAESAVSQVPQRKLVSLTVACAVAAGASLVVSSAEARIPKVVVDPARSESPTYGGSSFPGVGQYQKSVGTATGELDPADPKNAVIVDIANAERNAAGK